MDMGHGQRAAAASRLFVLTVREADWLQLFSRHRFIP
jgi:hypothetical protein